MSTAHQNGKYYFLKNNFFKSITSLKIVNLLKKYFLLDKISKKFFFSFCSFMVLLFSKNNTAFPPMSAGRLFNFEALKCGAY